MNIYFSVARVCPLHKVSICSSLCSNSLRPHGTGTIALGGFTHRERWSLLVGSNLTFACQDTLWWVKTYIFGPRLKLSGLF